MDRRIASILAAQEVIDDGDMLLYRALPAAERMSVGPFVFVDHYRHQSRRGIGDRPHPHAGIEVLSYLLEGGVEHRDSAGFRDELGPGDAQWIRAGRGILHAEQPTGGRHGLQLWTSLPPAQKFIEPAYASFRAADIPHVILPGATIDVVAGTVAGAVGPMVLTRPTIFALVRLDPGATARLDVDEQAELALYVLEGALKGREAPIGKGMIAILTAGSSIALSAAKDAGPTIVAVIGGEPADEPMLFSGPFVMDTPEHLARAKRDYALGRMGRLDGVPF
jgi:redox-sensitive bicupin YhaK (pirin superfamily)